jgi:3-oxoacyl-[acyl-carrier-protein] synthase II
MKIKFVQSKIIKMTSILSKSIPIVKQRRVVVTGLGIISPLGNSIEKFWNSLLEEKCGIKKILFEDYKPKGEFNKFNPEQFPSKVGAPIDADFKIQNYTKLHTRMSKAIQYGFAASVDALKDANWFPNDEHEKKRTGVSIGSSMGGFEELCEMNDLINSGMYRKISPFAIPKMLINLTSGYVSIEYGFKGPNHSVSTACATGGNSVGDAFRFIKYGDADVMVCGGVEAAIHPTAYAGFGRANALSTKFNDNPQEASRPFDDSRDGFVIGEGAGILILEEYEHAMKRNAKIYAEIRGYGMGGDSYHITSPYPDGRGEIQVMESALQESGLDPADIQYINAHATSTPTGDAIEYRAISELFKENPIKISSIKGATGHLLGAAGAVESISTVLTLKHNIIPPTLNFKEFKDLNKNVEIVNKKNSHEVYAAISNSFGFGGANTSLLFTKFLEN